MRKTLASRFAREKSSSQLTDKRVGKFALGSNSKPSTHVGHDLETNDIFHLSHKFRQNHTHVLGTTGTGKSKFLEHILRQDMVNRNCGLCLIDPHGKLYKDLLSYAATEKSGLAKRLVLFDPFNDLENCIGFNPLPNDKQRFDYIEKNFVAACLKAWGQDDIKDTPRIALWLKNIAHTLLVNDMTLLESAVLTTSSRNDPERRRLVENVTHYLVRSDWNDFFNGTDTKRKEMVEGAGNRLRMLLDNEVIRLVIGQQDNVLNFEKIMAEGKILLINLNDENKRVTSPDASFLGTMIVSELFRCARLRDHEDPRLKPFYVYIDEFAQYVTNDISNALEEARKFKCFYTLAHQHLAQLKKEDSYVYSSVIGNCKNKVVFGGLSDEDLDLMTAEIHTNFVDLKAIKHQQMRIRNRMIETTRKVVQQSRSVMTGQADQTTSTETESESVADGHSTSETHSAGRTESSQTGRTQTRSHADMMGSSDSTNSSQSLTDTTGSSSSQTNSKGASEGQSQGLNFGRSDAHTDGKSRSDSSSRTDGRGSSHTDGQSTSQTIGQANTSSQGNTESNSSGFSRMESQGQNDGSSRSATTLKNEFEAASTVRADNSGRSRNSGHTDSESYGSAHSSSRSLQDSRSQTKGHNSSDTQSKNSSETYGRNNSISESDAHTESSGENYSKSSATNYGQSDTTGTNASQSVGKNNSQGHTDSQSSTDTFGEGTSQVDGKSTSESIGRGKTVSQTRTKGYAKAEGSGHTDSSSETLSQGESWVPFHEIEEVEEVASVQFWSLNDLMYMKKAEMKTQNTGKAVIKIGNLPPVQCQIAHVTERVLTQRKRKEVLKRFKQKVADRHEGQYLPLRETRKRIRKRQADFFGEPINFYDTLVDPEEESQAEEAAIIIDPNDPFTR